jgi:benzoyl-CoA reductase/2-hydroxyglutaryl-CoA dehydratase subunit BcrC/BadD/HgdB
VDWKEFNKTLTNSLLSFQPDEPTVTIQEFTKTAKGVTDAILSTIDKHVPYTRPSPHSKRWWTKDLSTMKEKTAKLTSISFTLRALPDHLSHKEHRELRNKYAKVIKQTKHNHWLD